MSIHSRAPVTKAISAGLICLIVAACASRPIPSPPASRPLAPPLSAVLAPVATSCAGPPAYKAAAAYNSSAQHDLMFAPFGRPETGWAIYGPLAAHTIGSDCAPQTPGFAFALARWQAAQGGVPDGALTPATFSSLKGIWQEQRPFLMLRVKGVCPPGADEATLETLSPEETLGGKPVRLRPGAAAALRLMVQAAREGVPQAAADPQSLGAFSGYRSPAADDGRCEREHNCQGLVRAQCSAHRTGLAVDIDVGAAPGMKVDSSADENRLYQSQTPAYRWLVRNAARFGFVNYPFEPWHWEWTGEAP